MINVYYCDKMMNLPMILRIKSVERLREIEERDL